jgi:hypothetical protein
VTSGIEATEVVPARGKKEVKKREKDSGRARPVVWSFMVRFLFERDYL